MIVRHPEIAKSKRLERCSLAAYNAYAHLIAWSDDWARAEWNERKIVARLYPRHRSMHPGHVRKFLLEYQALGLIVKYVVEDVDYLEWQTPEFPLLARSSRRFMKVPPPKGAPREDHDRWVRGGGTPVINGTIDLPFDDLVSTSSRPPQSAADTGHALPMETGPPSVPAVPSGTNTPPTPLLTQGGAAALVRTAPITPEQLVAAQVEVLAGYVIRLGGRADRSMRRRLKHCLRAGYTMAELLQRLAARVLEDRRRLGEVDWWTPWPPLVDGAPPEAPAPGSLFNPGSREEHNARVLELRERLERLGRRGRSPPA